MGVLGVLGLETGEAITSVVGSRLDLTTGKMNQHLLQLNKQLRINIQLKTMQRTNTANVVVVMSSCELSGPGGHDVIVSSAGKARRTQPSGACLVNIR